MATSVTCDRCERDIEGARVNITTEATDEAGVNVDVAKRWVLCRECADKLFDRIGEASPWVDDDFKTVVLPGEEAVSQQAGGYSSAIDA